MVEVWVDHPGADEADRRGVRAAGQGTARERERDSQPDRGRRDHDLQTADEPASCGRAGHARATRNLRRAPKRGRFRWPAI